MKLNQQTRILKEDKSYVGHEKDIQKFWKDINIIKKLQDSNKENKQFKFMDGPPFLTGLPHYGTLMISYMKSTVLQYMQMRGMNCHNMIGYDCHGLPMEMIANKELGVYTKPEIKKLGIGKYNEKCKEIINTTSNNWVPVFERIGRMADYGNCYKTMDLNFMESTWWAFKQLWEKGLVYQSYKVVPFSTGCESSLSNFESKENYKELHSKSIYVCFKVKDTDNVYFVAWTSMPMTLVANVALCVNPDGDYVRVVTKERDYIVAKNCVNNLKVVVEGILEEFLGEDLVGMEYEPIFPYLNNDVKKYCIISDNFVDQNNKIGTGIVHCAPAMGPEDYEACVKNKIVIPEEIYKYDVLTDHGIYIDKVKMFKGRYCFDPQIDEDVIKYLKTLGLHIRTESYKHSYPYCYRTDTPLIFKPIKSIFIKASDEKLKSRMMELNKKINWYPGHVGSGRFTEWLRGAQDWNVSRNRFFGTPIPVWIDEKTGKMICIGSIDELMEKADLKNRPVDIHLEFVKNLEINGLKHCEFVFDCWFESGCVPYGQIHYPFENKELLDNREYLSDYICEGMEQANKWFYTLHVISTAIFDKPAFHNVIATGVILDETGLKLSKKYGNFKDPFVVLNKYGSDSLRLYLVNSPLIKAQELYFTESSLDVTRQKLIPYINAVKFFLVQLLDFTIKSNKFDSDAWMKSELLLDIWIITRMNKLQKIIESSMEQYQMEKCIQAIYDYIEDLTNWYIKFNRDRLRGFSGDSQWNMSLAVLYHVLINLCVVMCPFTPFLSEYIFGYLKMFDNSFDVVESVLLCKYPQNIQMENKECLKQMENLKKIVVMVRNARSKSTNIKGVRIPIKKIIIYHNDEKFIEDIKLVENLAREEINCECFEYSKLSDNASYIVTPNEKSIGLKFKGNAKLIKHNLSKIGDMDVADLLNGKKTCVNLNIAEIEGGGVITKDDIKIEIKLTQLMSNFVCESIDDLLVSVDVTYDEESHNSYQMRLLTSSIQKFRKTTNLNPWNKIKIILSTHDDYVNRLLLTEKYNLGNRLKSEIEILQKYMSDQTEFGKNIHVMTTYDKNDIEIKFVVIILDN